MPKNPIAFLLIVIVLHVSVSFADIPPQLSASDRLHSCDPRIALQAADEFLHDPGTLKEPIHMFYPAAILYQNGRKDEAVFWFQAAQLRTRYQLAFEKGDRGQLLSIMQMTIGPPINNYAYQDAVRFDRIIDQVLEWDKIAPNPWKNRPRLKDTEASLEKVYSGIRELKTKLLAERDELEKKARLAAPQMDRLSDDSRVRACRPGEPDPALANRTIEMEKKTVTDFARNHKDVLKESGSIKFANVAVYKLSRDSGLPSRYSVAVEGVGKQVFAEVNVSRSANGTNFVLACVSPLSPGQRSALKDVCKN